MLFTQLRRSRAHFTRYLRSSGALGPILHAIYAAPALEGPFHKLFTQLRRSRAHFTRYLRSSGALGPILHAIYAAPAL